MAINKERPEEHLAMAPISLGPRVNLLERLGLLRLAGPRETPLGAVAFPRIFVQCLLA
jgi:hypothetical protein